MASRILNGLTIRRPDHPAIDGWAERVRSLVESIDDPDRRVILSAPLGMYDYTRGAFQRSRITYDLVRPAVEAGAVSVVARLGWLVMDAANARNAGDLDAATRAVRRGLELSRSSGVQLFELRLLAQRGYNALAAGDLDDAERQVAAMRERLDRAPQLDLVHHHLVAGHLASRRGRGGEAREHAAAAVRYAREAGGPYFEALAITCLVQALLEIGDHDEAEARIEEGREVALRSGSGMIAFLTGCARATLARRRGVDPTGPLREAFTLGARSGYVTTPWWSPDRMAELCAIALAEGIEPGYAATLVRLRRLAPPTGERAVDALDLERWPWPLRITTFGGLAVRRGDEELALPARSRRRPLEVLKYLLTLGGREVAAERIAEALWPDAEGDAAQRTFQTTLSRLRKWLGEEDAIRTRDGRISLDERVVWVDARDLDERLDELERAVRHGEGSSALLEGLERQVAKHREPFLIDDEEPWVIAERDRLRRRLARVAREITALPDDRGSAEILAATED